MPKRKTEPTRKSPAAGERFLIRFLLAVAFCVSAYLAWNSLQGGGVPGCGPESDCDKVLSSRWAYILGMPVSLLALPVYLATIVVVSQKTLRWHLVVPLGLITLLAALWFVALQAFALRAFCKFCMTAHVAGALAALMLLKNNPLSARATAGFGGFATASIALLVLVQVTSPAPGPVQIASNTSVVNTNLATPRIPALASTSASVVRTNSPATFSFIDGEFTVDLTKVPVSGRLDAPKKMVKLFDYTCHHCRDLHHLLKPVKHRYANELAVISLPVPLDASCNSVVRRTAPAHMHACEYAKTALAVFFANREKFEEFSDWLFAPEHPPDFTEARAHAEGLVGKEAFADAMSDPRIEQQIQTDVAIYSASSRKAKRGAMPQLLFAHGGSIGSVPNADVLDKILFDALGLGDPPQAR